MKLKELLSVLCPDDEIRIRVFDLPNQELYETDAENAYHDVRKLYEREILVWDVEKGRRLFISLK